MSAWRENIERVRALLAIRVEDIEPVGWGNRKREVLSALTALTTQIEELERVRDGFDESNKALYEHLALAKNRSEVAEQRVKELERHVA